MRIVRSRVVTQAVLPSSYTRTYLAGSLGSTGVTPLPRYYEPRRLPARAARTVMSSRPALGARPTPPGLPGSSVDPSPRAVPNHPGESRECVYPLLPRGCQASPSLAGWPLSTRFNEAEAGSLDYGSRLRRPRLRTWITPEFARWAFWRTGNYQSKLLSACGINQASPGAPMQSICEGRCLSRPVMVWDIKTGTSLPSEVPP